MLSAQCEKNVGRGMMREPRDDARARFLFDSEEPEDQEEADAALVPLSSYDSSSDFGSSCGRRWGKEGRGTGTYSIEPRRRGQRSYVLSTERLRTAVSPLAKMPTVPKSPVPE